ncbi:MAG TPA: choice-of-anchor D domain-containing protein, partial [Myxococcota bacterium]
MRAIPHALVTTLAVLGLSDGCSCGAEPIAAVTVTLRVAPASVDFGSIPVGASVKATVAIVNSGNGPFTPSGDPASVTKVSGAGFALATPCSLPLPPAGLCNVDIAFTPLVEGPLTGVFIVHGPDGDIQVPLTGHADPATITVDPPVLDFGAITAGVSTEKTIAVTNAGGTDVSAPLHISGAGFFAGGGSSQQLALSAGSTTTVAVTFSPSQGGAANGSAVVEIC